VISVSTFCALLALEPWLTHTFPISLPPLIAPSTLATVRTWKTLHTVVSHWAVSHA
jgi:hypothetical protein